MQVLHSFQTSELASLAVSFLEAEGIEAYVWDENTSSLYPLFNPSIGMVRVAVGESDFEKASVILNDYLEME